ncbi:alpha/beta fold hydrolase [Nocardia sp. alder85J]|uniref:alpha/beta fold hydrolase n=1 Tax=Nocardia sp. alder85J TaxID=2862949 RepID=UPI001CD74EF2|nr:alpha/beta hydrolase [Nocardia sp. alder85J]MCX4099019.1 alpha/beta hydrolase [Nocardia sp. alder85J]
MTAAVPAVPTAAAWITEGHHFTTHSGHRIHYRRRGTGPILLLLHGFPTWSYDYAPVATELARDHDVITVDFLGYGASDKPRGHEFTVAESADTVEDLLAHLNLGAAHLICHDYGDTVAQELLDRRRTGALPFTVESLVLLNGGIAYDTYRPTLGQRLLITPVLGRAISNALNPRLLRRALDAVRGDVKLTDAEFAELWVGMSRDNGHKLAWRLIRYNRERATQHPRWEAALTTFDKPLHLIWGPADPVSGQHVLDRVLSRRTAATTVLPRVGHFPQSEAPSAVAAAIRTHVDGVR